MAGTDVHRMMPPIHRQNTRIVFDQPLPGVDIQMYTTLLPDDGIMVRNLFTLVGIGGEESFLSSLPFFQCLPSHTGYTSIGVVEETGNKHTRFIPGALIVMPACYEAFITLSGRQIQELSKNLFVQLSVTLDNLVNALFFPFIGLSFYLIRCAEKLIEGPIALIGDGLLLPILCKIIQEEYEDLPIYVLSSNATYSMECAGQNIDFTCLKWNTCLSDPIVGKLQTVFLLSSAESYESLAYKMVSPHGQILRPYLPDGYECKNMADTFWLTKDIIWETLEFLQKQHANFYQLVEHHVHAEAIVQFYQLLQQKIHQGGFFVCDW